MNTDENKAMLWDTLTKQNRFNPSVSFRKTQDLFEMMILDLDAQEGDVATKNDAFLAEFSKALENVDENLSRRREKIFEERVLQNQTKYKATPPNYDLAEIKKLLYVILDKVEKL